MINLVYSSRQYQFYYTNFVAFCVHNTRNSEAEQGVGDVGRHTVEKKRLLFQNSKNQQSNQIFIDFGEHGRK